MRLSLLFASAALPALITASPVFAQGAPTPATPSQPGSPSPAAPPVAGPAATSTIAPDANAPRGRLSDAVRPIAYRIDLTVDPAKPRFSGTNEIDVEVRRAGSRVLYMHGRDLAVQSVVARIGRAGAIEGRGASYIRGRWTMVDATGVVRVDFDRPLPAGAMTLLVNYDAAFGDGPAGLHRVRVGDAWYAWTQHESIDARATFPSFDEPGFKVPFTVTLRTPRGFKAVSNAPETGVIREGALDVHRFAPTLPLPTYLVAMMVGPFAVARGDAPANSQRAEPLPLRIVATQPNAGRMEYARTQSAPIVALLEQYFGERFPFPKLDQIGSPIEGGAMENAGADLYDDTILLLDPDASTARKRNFGMVVAHELAHQWFGDMVTPAWWDDIWLNESFANWMGYRIGDAWRPDLNIRAGALAEGYAAMDTDALLAGRPIHQAIATSDQIDSAFDTITYGKGGHVVAMIAAYMGDARFQQGVRDYLAAHRYGNATSTDFFGEMAQVSGDPAIVPAMQSFIDQQGVPLLTFTGSGRTMTVGQSRYVAFGETVPAQRWGVPVCVRRVDDRSPGKPDCTLLTKASATLGLAGAGPFMPNAGGTGYYRFELPRAQWDALIGVADRLQGGEALALTDSLKGSIRAGRSGIAPMARLLKVLAPTPDSYASDAPATALQDLVDRGFADAAGTAGWRRYLGSLYAPMLPGFGLDLRRGAYAAEPPERSQRRVAIVARLFQSNQDALVRGSLVAAARAYLAGDAGALDPAYVGTAMTAYVQADGLPGAKALAARALKSEDPSFRPAALAAIGGSGMPEVASWALDFTDPALRLSERRSLLGDVLDKSSTRDLGYAWLRRNLTALIDPGAGVFFATRLPRFVSGFCSVARADELARDIAPKLAGTPGALEMARTVERVRNCGRLLDARGTAFAAEFAALR